ncbi:MAG: hypothetical protein ACI8XC_001697, partial [Gammaproteobacteria bacterium]
MLITADIVIPLTNIVITSLPAKPSPSLGSSDNNSFKNSQLKI